MLSIIDMQNQTKKEWHFNPPPRFTYRRAFERRRTTPMPCLSIDITYTSIIALMLRTFGIEIPEIWGKDTCCCGSALYGTVWDGGDPNVPVSGGALNGCASVLNTNSSREIFDGSSRVKNLRNIRLSDVLCSSAVGTNEDVQVFHHLGEEEAFSVIHSVVDSYGRIIYVKYTAYSTFAARNL